MFIFPAGQKNLPYTRFMKFPYADEMIDFILERSTTGLRLKTEDFKGLGRQSTDEQALHRRIDKEGVIVFADTYDEL